VGHRPEHAVQAVVVDRDSISSHLLADVLIRDLKYKASAASPSSLLHSLNTRRLDLVVIGAELKSTAGSGYDLAAEVFRAQPEASIVMLLDRITRDGVIGAFRSGARGVFSRQRTMAEFSECAEHVRGGLLWAGKEEFGFLLDALRSIPAPTIKMSSAAAPLTTRELQVVRHAAQGKTNRMIAEELGLSEHTIKNYLFRAFGKLGVSNRIELLFYLTMKEPTATGEDMREREGEFEGGRSHA
jgi:DNA-binding NarL/FixJ family response regulator